MGGLGWGSLVEFLNIIIREDIVGLFCGIFCMYNRLIWVYWMIWIIVNGEDDEYIMDGLIILSKFFFF